MRTTRFVWAALVAAAAAGPAVAQTTEETNKMVFAAWGEAVNARDYDRLDDFVAANVVRHSQATPDVEVKSLEEFKALLRRFGTEAPDWRVECPMVVAEGDLVAGWCVYTGTQEGPMGPFPPTGKRMELDSPIVARFEDGKIAELWATWDNLAGLTQLGLFPPPCMSEPVPTEESR